MSQCLVISASFRTYLSADLGSFVCHKNELQVWQRWTIIKEGDHFFFKTVQGHYLRGYNDGTVNISSNKGDWVKIYISCILNI